MGFFEGKRCLFFGKKNCSLSSKCVHLLNSYGCSVDSVFNDVRGAKLPSDVFSWKGDFIISYHNYWLLPSSVLESAGVMAINFHPATPSFPGSGSYSWAIYENAKEFGVTVHLMDEKFDHGRILQVYKFNLDEGITLMELIQKAKAFSFECFEDFINSLNEKKLDQVLLFLAKGSGDTWQGDARKISDIERMRVIPVGMSPEETARRIRAFHTPDFPVIFE